MRKALITISLVLLLTALLLGQTACNGTTITDSDLATIRGLIARVDNLESSDATQNSKLTNLSTGTLQTDVSQVKSDIAAIKADITVLKSANSTDGAKVAALEARIKALEDKLATGSTNQDTLSGQVTLTVKEGSPIYLYTGPGVATTYNFTVHIVNGTNTYQYVNYSLVLLCLTPTGDAASASLTRWTYITTFTPTYSRPTPTTCNQILFTPGTMTAFSMAAGQTYDVVNQVTITTTTAEQWQGNVIPVYAAIWF